MLRKTKVIIALSVIGGIILVGGIAAAIACIIIFVVNKSPSTASSSQSKTACSYGFQGDNCTECGQFFYDQNIKIVGGVDAVAYSWPSIALIIFSFSESVKVPGTSDIIAVSQSFICGGSLINTKTIVTAAHCVIDSLDITHNGNNYKISVDPTVLTRYKVYLGAYDQNDLTNPNVFTGTLSKFVVLNLEGIYPIMSEKEKHPNYDKNSKINDIAVIKLASDVTLNRYIQLACLPNPTWGSYPKNTDISSWATGWGTTSSGGSASDILKNVKLMIYDSSKCSDVAASTTKDWSLQICAGNYSGYQDTCQGDSGGPLFVKDTVNDKSKYVLAGVVSYGEGCASAGKPGIYVRVSAYLDWINSYA